jgi:hypothetical protein
MCGYPYDQEFRVDVSNDGGGSWVNVETSVMCTGGWELMEVPLAGPIGPTDQMCLRFVAEDIANAGSVIEAAVDDIRVTGYTTLPTKERPLLLSLSVPRPNPAAEEILLAFTLPRKQQVEMGIYDTAGRLVRRLLSEVREAGIHRLNWDGRMSGGRVAPCGVYFVRMSAERQERTRKIIVTR